MYTVSGIIMYRTKELTDCPLFEDQEEIASWAMVLAIGSVPIFLVAFALAYKSDEPSAILFSQAYACFEFACFGIIVILRNRDKCGMKITLCWGRGATIRTKYYRFSGSPERDVGNVKKIVDGFALHAKKLYADDESNATASIAKRNAEKLKEEKCRAMHEEIIEKVGVK